MRPSPQNIECFPVSSCREHVNSCRPKLSLGKETFLKVGDEELSSCRDASGGKLEKTRKPLPVPEYSVRHDIESLFWSLIWREKHPAGIGLVSQQKGAHP